MNKEELLQNDIIRVMRIYFNDKPCKEWITEFARQCAIDYQKKNKELKADNERLEKALRIIFDTFQVFDDDVEFRDECSEILKQLEYKK